MAGLPQFLISTQTDPYWEIPFFDAAGNPLSVEGRTFEAWIAPATAKTGVGEPVAPLKVLTFQDGLSLVPPTDGSGDQTVKNTFVHRVSRAFAQANFPRGELTADLLEVVDGARRLLVPVRLRYDDPAAIRDFVADRAGVTFGQGRQPIITPVAVAGQTGARGTGFLTGSLAPQPSDGENGDYWVVERDGQANLLYGPKDDGEWPPQPSSTLGVGGVADVPGLPGALAGKVSADGRAIPTFAGDTLNGGAGEVPARRWTRGGVQAWAEQLLPESDGKTLDSFAPDGTYLGYGYRAQRATGGKGRGAPVMRMAACNFFQPRAVSHADTNVLGNITNHDTANQPPFTTITNGLITTSGSNTVLVVIGGHGLSSGLSQWLRLKFEGGQATFGGLTIKDGPYRIVGYPNLDSVFIEVPGPNATANVAGGGKVVLTLAINVQGETNRVVIRDGNRGFPVGRTEFVGFNFDFEEAGASAEGRWYVVQSSPTTSVTGGNTNMGEHNPVNRYPDRGFGRSPDVLQRQMMGFLWAPETTDVVSDGGGAGVGAHSFSPQSVLKSPNKHTVTGYYVGWYQGHHIGPGALVGQGRDPVTGHGGVGDVTHGDYTEANFVSTTAGSASVWVQLRFEAQFDVGDEFIFARPVSVGGLTLRGPYTVATKSNGNSLTFLAPANATATVPMGNFAGFGKIISFKKDRPRAIQHAYGGYVEGLNYTKAYFESGRAMMLATGMVFTWLHTDGTVSNLTTNDEGDLTFVDKNGNAHNVGAVGPY
ncbi:hypothetical protein, partial [Methylobacterium sp. J-068]|uniref:hypothetical protein n=1 Tax=Methylobacterium sp. J-068 TaxID=2836649 RepID=UPI001FB91CA2